MVPDVAARLYDVRSPAVSAFKICKVRRRPACLVAYAVLTAEVVVTARKKADSFSSSSPALENAGPDSAPSVSCTFEGENV